MKSRFLLLVICILIPLSLCAQEYAIYVSDAANFSTGPYKILKYDPDGSNPVVFIDSNLAWPQDILFLEDQGVVLISNLSSDTITRHDASTGEYIDNFATGIDGPTRMKIGPDDLIYVLQWLGNGRVFRYNQDGSFVDEFTDTGVAQSIGIDWDSSGNLYVSSYTGDFVKQYDTNGNEIGDFITANLVGPTNILFDDSGDLLVFDYDGGAVKRFSSTGVFEGEFIGGLQFPEGVAIHPDNGNIYLGNGGTAAVKRYTAAGTFIDDIVASGSGGLLTPNAVVLRDNTLSVAEFADAKPLLINTFGSNIQLHPEALNYFDNVTVYTISGQKVFDFSVENSIWDATTFAKGMYLVVGSTKGKKQTQRVVIR